MSVERPPINSLMKELAFIKAYIDPKQIKFEKISVVESSKENVTSKIIEIKICKKSREIKILNHDLKKQIVLLSHKDNIANGLKRMNTFIIIYLIA